jgi:crossover junction endodeoxyribonuclease RuvC
VVILGIDPGFHVTGFAILKHENNKSFLLDYGYLQMSSKKSLAERTKIFYDLFVEKIKKYQVTHVSLETSFLGKNAQTFLKLGYLRGILYLLSSQYKLEISEFAPREIKQSIVGFGGASKEQVAAMVYRMFPKLSEVKTIAKNDVTDALAICVCGFWSAKRAAVIKRAM